MNARALILILLVLAGVGGLGYFAFVDAPGPRRAEGPAAPGPARTTPRPTADSGATARTTPGARTELVGLSGVWSIFVVGPKGEPLPEAEIVARPVDDRTGKLAQSARGRATFTGLDPGQWELTVTHPAYPRRVDVYEIAGQGQQTRTTVQLTHEIRLTGVVVDQRGGIVRGVPVGLLPEFDSPPTEGVAANGLDKGDEGPAKEQSKRAQQNATTTTDGRFKLGAPAPGRYRLSVGRQGAEPRFESEAFDLDYGRERLVRLVIPAHAHLTIEVPRDDYKGPNVLAVLGQRDIPLSTSSDYNGAGTSTDVDGAARKVSPDEVEDTLRTKRKQLGEDLGKSEGSEGLDPAKLAQLTAEQAARVREAEERSEADRARRARLIEEGWATLRSARFDSGAIGEVPELPENKPLRFVLYRGVEGFTIMENLIAPRGASVTLRLTPPAPLQPGVPLSEFPRTAGSRLEITPIGPDALPLGLTFEN